jgi:hypothetical protein
MVRAAVYIIGRVAMAGQNNLNLHLDDALHDCVKIFHLEPKQHTIAVGFVSAIADGAVMVLDLKAVQLQDELAILHQLLILPAAMSPAATEQALIPAAAGFNIGDTDEWLGVHGSNTTKTPILPLHTKYELSKRVATMAATLSDLSVEIRADP